MKIFVSHSSEDAKVAELLIDLLRDSLNLPAKEIRCTSVEGYRLPVGATTVETLRREVHESEIFVALITPNSIGSPWVLFELGARWGSEKPLIPLLASGATTKDLKGPLGGINALDCAVIEQMYQVIDDAGRLLSVRPGTPSTYQRRLTALVQAAKGKVTPPKSIASPDASVSRGSAVLTDGEQSILAALGSDATDSDDEMSLSTLASITEMPRVKVEVLIDPLIKARLVAKQPLGFFRLSATGKR